MLRRAAVLKRICDRRRAQNATGSNDGTQQMLEQMIRKNPDKVGRIKRRNTFEHNEQKPENREWINRIFSRKRFHYEGRIHEQVVALDGNEDYENYQAPVTILHSGYDLPEEERKKKARRNIELLNQELQGLIQSVLGETGQKDCLTKITDCMKANDSLAAVEEFKKALKMPEGCVRGVNSYLACYNIGVIYECLGQMTEAEQYYNRCGGYEPAEKRLENMKK